MPFNETVANQVLVACQRCCCICHKFCGTKIEIHHIVHKKEGGRDDASNAIPLCFDCHADQSSYDHKHPKGRKYTRNELIAHRDNWYQRVSISFASSYDDGAKQLDAMLFQSITGLLPWDGAVRRLRQHSFAHPFRDEWVKPLFVFQERADDPSSEFLDADLEALRAELAESIKHFLDVLQKHTFDVDGREGISSVPREWRALQREEFYKAAHELESAADRIGSALDAFIRAGRRRLSSDVGNSK